MARPEYIAAVHAAKYDLMFSSGEEKPEKMRAYQQTLRKAAMKTGEPEYLIKRAIWSDFGVWIREEGLPKPPTS